MIWTGHDIRDAVGRLRPYRSVLTELPVRRGRVVLNYEWLSRDQKWYTRDCVDEWLHNLPVWWMALVVFAITYLAAGGIFATVMALAKGERVCAFKSVSPALLGPMGTVFGLLVVFSEVQVWSDMDRANVAVNREASAIRMVALLAPSFPGEPETQISTFSATILTKPFSLSGPLWLNNRLP